MIKFTEIEALFILWGIYFINLYFDAKFFGFILLTFLFFLIAILKMFNPFESMYQSLIIVLFMIPIGLYCLVKNDEFKKRGIKVFQTASKKNIVVMLILIGIFILLKLFYFDRGN